MKVIVALQTKEGKPKYLKMKKLENLRGTTIGKYANANIKEGSRIESNAASSYFDLDSNITKLPTFCNLKSLQNVGEIFVKSDIM